LTLRLTKFLQWPAKDDSAATLALSVSARPRETAIYLLHVAAEVEHALMAQYLYAAYSLGGDHLDAKQQRLVDGWKKTVAQIAREEMAHLATVENLLTLIGGPICFDREDYPTPTDLYPFPLELEPLSRRSLGKYILAESPSDEVIENLGLTQEIEAIKHEVDTKLDALKVRRVGLLYDKLVDLFTVPPQPRDPEATLPPFVAQCDISAHSIRHQVRAEEWGLGYKYLLIKTAENRDEAVAAIQAIAKEGEGADIGDLWESHFGRFLKIYREFPESGWNPSRIIAHNPSTHKTAQGNYIGNPVARTWAKLFNLRYRMLLMYLAHSFAIESPASSTARTPRGLLISWSFGEMYNLRSIAEILMTLPLNAPDNGTLAGPPFEMPYSLAMSPYDKERWRTHRDLVLASGDYIQRLKSHGNPQWNAYLFGLESANQTALEQILTVIGD
jgi:Ferritin-like